MTPSPIGPPVGRTFAAAAVALLALLAACGGTSSTKAGSAAPNVRTIDVAMVDLAFKPASIDVKNGETVRFVFHNEGKVTHEAVLGDQASQDAHEKDMSAGRPDMGNHDMGHTMDMPASAGTVEPGKTGSITHTFTNAGPTLIGCHEPGHYQAGMRITVQST